MPLVYDDLKRVARRQLRRHRAGATLDTTGLVHEAYLKMAGQRRLQANDREHLLAICARAMRQVIVDAARRRATLRRGNDAVRMDLEDAPPLADTDAGSIIEMDEALTRLGAWNQRLAQVVECRVFAGFTEDETAEALGISLRTAQRDWMRARAWLKEAFGWPGEAAGARP
jgi:RNA polymerase sigma factor (TIGR02999 family)